MFPIKKLITQQNRNCIQFFTRSISQNSIHYNTEKDKKVYYGFKQVTPTEKTEMVFELFKDASKKYDRYLDGITLFLQHRWKKYFVNQINVKPGFKLLDLAGGTGDIAFHFLNRIKGTRNEAGSHATVIDINDNMLEVGRFKANLKGFDPKTIAWKVADGENLPFEANTFDACTISLGIRNFTDVEKALEEIHRILKPGGQFLCLEFSIVDQTHPIFKIVYDIYNATLLHLIGRIFMGHWKITHYLVESIQKFPNQAKFEEMIKDAGFVNTKYENLLYGTTAIHYGTKPTQ